ncbi:MAG: hypothetical protein AB1Z21_09100, partial [Synechococcaceae cyanobacterium]
LDSPSDAPPAQAERADPDSGALVSTTWRDEQGREVGGWRWLASPAQPLRLLLFLGPEPVLTAPAADPGEAEAADAPVTGSDRPPLLILQARPQALAALNLLPGQLPLPLLQARQLLLLAEDGPSGGGISRLLGRLQLGELLPIQPAVPAPSGEARPQPPDPAP